MNLDSRGQNKKTWDNWNSSTVESQIQMWDFYGGRQYILKYVPRYGKVLEAGCGLGRYIFYLQRLGIDIEGLDFSEPTIKYLNDWKGKNGFDDVKIIEGNVESLPYEDNSLSGCISLGVIEHFIEGPQKALNEIFRVLRPGGVAIITTPSISYYMAYLRVKRKLIRFIKRIIGRNLNNDFFQYEYRPQTLKNFVKDCGLHVTQCTSADLLHTFTEIGNYNGENIGEGSFAYWFSEKFENTSINTIGAQSITISVKPARKMYCFLSGKFEAEPDSLEKYTVPISKSYQDHELSKFYLRGIKPSYASPYKINPPISPSVKRVCSITNEEYYSDKIFEDYGFNVCVSPTVLMNPEINTRLSNNNVSPIWRPNIK